MSIARGLPADFGMHSRSAAARDDGKDRADLREAAYESFSYDTAGPTSAGLAGSRADEATRDWFAAAQHIGRIVDLDTSAHAHGAMLRRRGVPSAENLLCLTLMYGPGRMPMRMITERADLQNIAHVTEPALLRRLGNAAGWTSHLVDGLIEYKLRQHGQPPTAGPGFPPSPIMLHSAVPVQSGSSHFLEQLRSQHNLQTLERQTASARRFIVDFVPWPEALFADTQIHWLLCVRWSLISASLRGTPGRYEADPTATTRLEQTRRNADLLAALLSSNG